MAGPNLELFKFSLYLFFPLAVMVHYGDPQWYHDNVLPFRDRFWPDPEGLYKPPRNTKDVKQALEEFRQKRLLKADAGSADAAASSSASTSSAPGLRPDPQLGTAAQQTTTTRKPTWRETWPEAQQRKVV